MRDPHSRLPGSTASVDFWLPGDRRAISTKVQVITLDEAQGGRIIMRMRFCNLDEASRVRIERFLAAVKRTVSFHSHGMQHD